MVIYIFRFIRGTSHCIYELWLFIYSGVYGVLLSVLIRGTSLCADELWLFIYIQRAMVRGHFSLVIYIFRGI